MSSILYSANVSIGEDDGALIVRILHGDIKTPPIGEVGRRRIGFLLRFVQAGVIPPSPNSRPMPGIGPNCHELRVSDDRGEWRVIYQVRPDLGAVLIGDVFSKKSRATPKRIIDQCRKRFDQAGPGE